MLNPHSLLLKSPSWINMNHVLLLSDITHFHVRSCSPWVFASAKTQRGESWHSWPRGSGRWIPCGIPFWNRWFFQWDSHGMFTYLYHLLVRDFATTSSIPGRVCCVAVTRRFGDVVGISMEISSWDVLRDLWLECIERLVIYPSIYRYIIGDSCTK